MKMESVTREEKGRLTVTVEGAKKVSKKGLTKVWKKKLLGG
jgi:hypothetical protein